MFVGPGTVILQEKRTISLPKLVKTTSKVGKITLPKLVKTTSKVGLKIKHFKSWLKKNTSKVG